MSDALANSERFVRHAQKGRANPLWDGVETALKAMGKDSRFVEADAEQVWQHVKALPSEKLKDPALVVEQVHSHLSGDSKMAHIIKTIKTAKPGAFEGNHPVDKPRIRYSYSASSASTAKPASSISTIGAQWERLTHEMKVSVGLSGATALLAGFGALRSFANATRKDEQGNTHLNVSNVGLGLVMGLFAIGSGYLAMSQLRAGAVR